MRKLLCRSSSTSNVPIPSSREAPPPLARSRPSDMQITCACKKQVCRQIMACDGHPSIHRCQVWRRTTDVMLCGALSWPGSLAFLPWSCLLQLSGHRNRQAASYLTNKLGTRCSSTNPNLGCRAASLMPSLIKLGSMARIGRRQHSS